MSLATLLLAWQAQAAPANAAPAAAELPARLVAQREVALADAAAIEASGIEPRFVAALDAVVAANPGDPDLLPFVPVRSGLVPIGAFRAFARWNRVETAGRPQVANDRAIANHPFEAIVDFDRQLAARGVELLVVLLPSRLEVHPELVLDLPATGFVGLGSGTQRFVAALAEAGVDALSLTRLFVERRYGELPSDQLFLQSDPHLTPRGYELAARATAERLATLPGYAPGTLQEGRDFDVVQSDFGYQPGETLVKQGAVIEAVRGPTLQKERAIVDFCDKEAPIVVLGDSHSRLHSFTACDYVSQLARFTRQKVDFLKSDGGAADVVRRKLGRREPERWQTMKTIVWLVPETLLVPAQRWKAFPISAE